MTTKTNKPEGDSSARKSYKFVHEDKVGNKYYPHTMADIVHIDENTKLDEWIEFVNQKLNISI